MTTPTGTGNAKQPAPNSGVKRGLPNIGLPEAEKMATKLWGIARLGKASTQAFAKQLGLSTSSGSWDTRLALMKGFQLIEKKDDQIGLTTLGQQLVNSSDPEQQKEARRAAVLHLKAYRELVTDFDGTPVPAVDVLASRLQYDYGKKEDFATAAANAFINSLQYAEMIDTSGVVRIQGDDKPGISELNDVPDEEESENDADIDRAFGDGGYLLETGPGEEPNNNPVMVEYESFPAAESHTESSIKLSVTLDLSKYRADEVIQILSSLGLTHRA
ncbi:hypothetical protein QRX50_18305 [Amycolatopsis carbonis]|uniref:Uncharacterized protein n=1 Tax=Amycolatopsis carbonis TaxID=715471 RepID=A0A9Y2ILL2_9PSEU|nr:hypothetical protein [Amycolatopsis sp. 2-15]WIX82580.1 hypothetical protein QRX50_18305 [Amycolatopsis sp. 2-15]